MLALGDLGHAVFDRGEVFRREGALVREVVVEAVVDHRPDRHLGIGEQLLHRVRQQVGGGVADDVQAVLVLVGDDRQFGVGVEAVRQIHQTPADAPGQRGLGEPGTDGRRDLGNGHRMVEAADGTIGKRDVGHGSSLWQCLPGEIAGRDSNGTRIVDEKKARSRRAFFSSRLTSGADLFSFRPEW